MILSHFIAKAQCYFWGHKRGKATAGDAVFGMQEYRCPRCKVTWTRKVRKPKQEA